MVSAQMPLSEETIFAFLHPQESQIFTFDVFFGWRCYNLRSSSVGFFDKLPLFQKISTITSSFFASLCLLLVAYLPENLSMGFVQILIFIFSTGYFALTWSLMNFIFAFLYLLICLLIVCSCILFDQCLFRSMFFLCSFVVGPWLLRILILSVLTSMSDTR
jgi:hypothetical protein